MAVDPLTLDPATTDPLTADPATLTGRPWAVDLDSGCPPERLLARLRACDRPAVLSGRWFGGGTLILRHPLTVAPPSPTADLHLLARQPRLDPDAADLVGGGWVTGLGFSPATSSLAFHGSLLRWRPAAGWVFESLGLAGREEADNDALAGWRAELATAEGPDADDPDPTEAVLDLGLVSTFEEPVAARDRYLADVESVIGRIHRGDFYQVNLCTRAGGRHVGEPARLFARVVARLRPDYAALVSGPDGRTVACFSPELFLTLHGRRVHTSPIKGTAPRAPGESDSPALRASAKDAAENVMIVDLMRHDLAKVSVPGSVAVPELLALRPHPGLWHLVSTVTAELRPEVDVTDLLQAAFPPGSVTGAPKSSALRAIAELEPVPRGAYTGSLGLVSPLAGAELNVAIRAFELDGETLQLGVGGGITADSVPVREWYECWHKAAPLVAAAGGSLDPALPRTPLDATPAQRAAGVFESVLVSAGRPLRLAAHLARLDLSCRELYGLGLPEDVTACVQARVAEAHVEGRGAVRVAVSWAEGRLEVEVTVRPLGARLECSRLAWAPRPTVAWRHKWTDRAELEAAEAAVGPALPYFTVQDGGAWVTEVSRGNLFRCDAAGVWSTPPLDEHLLPGVTRREVLDLLTEQGVPVEVRRFGEEELRASQAVFWTSSLSGVVAVTAVDGHPLPAPPPLLAALNAALHV